MAIMPAGIWLACIFPKGTVILTSVIGMNGRVDTTEGRVRASVEARNASQGGRAGT